MHTQTETGENELHPIVLKILENRGYDSYEKVQDFLSWDLKTLPKLTDLKDMGKVSSRIIQAIKQGEKIGIYGDYDVDGTTSCALFYYFFKMLDIEVELIQPSRFVEGYGIHPSSIDQAIEKDINLLITVDCGITNTEACDYAKNRGLDLIITDHHKDACAEMPEAFAIVNPNRRDEPEDSELKILAGVAVAFCVCLQVKTDLEKEGRVLPSLYPLLQFVSIGTICDLAPLKGANLKLVRHGISQLLNSSYSGIQTFFTPEERKTNEISSEKLSFNIGPMINSKGRLDHPEEALNLLIADDFKDAYKSYSQLEISNRDRKFIQAEVFKSAKEQVIDNMVDDNHAISVVFSPDWHEGVIGIVASKLVENFKVPAIVFTESEDENIIKASARTAGELNLFDLLKSCEHHFVKFGGHKAAAGLSMPKENFEAFKKEITEKIKEIPLNLRTKFENYDLEIKPEDISPKLLNDLNKLEPFGNFNPKPLFKMSGVKLASYKILKDQHVSWNFESLEDPSMKFRGISFFYIDKWQAIHPQEIFQGQGLDNPLTIEFYLSLNHFNGNKYIQLMIQAISP